IAGWADAQVANQLACRHVGSPISRDTPPAPIASSCTRCFSMTACSSRISRSFRSTTTWYCSMHASSSDCDKLVRGLTCSMGFLQFDLDLNLSVKVQNVCRVAQRHYALQDLQVRAQLVNQRSRYVHSVVDEAVKLAHSL